MKEFIITKQKRKEYVQFTCRIEEELLQKIRRIVVENNLDSANWFINECIRFAVRI